MRTARTTSWLIQVANPARIETRLPRGYLRSQVNLVSSLAASKLTVNCTEAIILLDCLELILVPVA